MEKNKEDFFEVDKGSNIQLSKNFKSNEMDCRCNRSSCKTTRISKLHIELLQQLRDEVGPLRINSAFRCVAHNIGVGGGTKSQHLICTATDIVPMTETLEKVYDKAKLIFNGIGLYKKSGFIHIDSRVGRKAKWFGR